MPTLAAVVRVTWPKHLNSLPFPKVDGVFCLYDVTNKESVATVPQALGKSTTPIYNLSETIEGL